MLNEREQPAQPNWIAILSYMGSLVISLAVWAGLVRMIEHFVK
jgi:hypothetical protein